MPVEHAEERHGHGFQQIGIATETRVHAKQRVREAGNKSAFQVLEFELLFGWQKLHRVDLDTMMVVCVGVSLQQGRDQTVQARLRLSLLIIRLLDDEAQLFQMLSDDIE